MITDNQKVPPDQLASHETVLQQRKKENELRYNDSEAEGSVPQGENTQRSNSLDIFSAHFK